MSGLSVFIFDASKIENVISSLGQEGFDLEMFREYVPSVADCNRSETLC